MLFCALRTREVTYIIMKSTGRKKRRAYLQDFVRNADGTYEYVGTAYAYSAENGTPRKAFLARVAVCSAVCAASVALKGTVPSPGTDNSPFVLLPYAACAIAMLIFLWATAGILFSGDPIREYKLERAVRPIMRRAAAFAIAEGLCAVGETVFIIMNGVGDKLIGAIAFYALCALGAASAMYVGRTVSSAKWTKIERKSRIEK